MTVEHRGLARGPVYLHATVILTTLLLLVADVLPVLFTGDVNRYHTIATGPTFWTAQPVEFPPLSAAMVWAVGRWGANAIKVLFLTNLALDIATAAVLLRGASTRAAERYLLLTVPLLPFTLFRLDHLGVLVAAIGLVVLHRGRRSHAGVLLGLGTLAKLWPAALLAASPRRHRGTLAWGLTTLGIGTVTWVGLFGRGALAQVVSFRGATGWHVESVVGGLVRLVMDPGRVEMTGGAWRVGTLSPSTLVVLALVGAGIVALTWRIPSVAQRHVALVSGLLCVSPLFSPQFVLWLVVPVALLSSGEVVARVAMGCTIAAATLTLAIASFYGQVLGGTVTGNGLVGLRNLFVVVLCVVALLPHLDREQTSRADTLPAG